VINEIMYNPPSGEDEPENEWIELYNTHGIDIEMSGWTIRDKVSSEHVYQIPDGTTIPAEGYMVLAYSATAFSAKYGFDPDLEYGASTNLGLNNDGNPCDIIVLKDDEKRTIDEVPYEDSATWCKGADGDGKSLERKDPLEPSDDPTNWECSSGVGGTPGTKNAYSGGSAKILSSLSDDETLPEDDSADKNKRRSHRVNKARIVDVSTTIMVPTTVITIVPTTSTITETTEPEVTST